MSLGATGFLKRGGLLLLGVFFWLQIVRLLFEIPFTTLMVLHWLYPDWDLGGFFTTCLGSATLLGWILNWLSWVGTALIGWSYVFRRRFKLLWLVIVLWGLGPLIAGVAGLSYAEPPADATLEANFLQHEAEFDRLAQMVTEDSRVEYLTTDRIVLVDNYTWPRPESQWGISRERWDEYRKLFAQLGLTHGFSRMTGPKYDALLLMVFAEMELGGCQVAKGYAYSTKPVVGETDSLDRLPRRSQHPAFKQVKGNWYLVLLRYSY